MQKKFIYTIAAVVLSLGIPLSVLTASHLTLNKQISQLRSQYAKFTDEEIAVVEAVKKSRNSVVTIVIRKEVFAPSERVLELDNGFHIVVPGELQSQGKQVVGKGSGFVVRSDGLIVTNKHVVGDKNAEYQAIFADGTKRSVKVVATDPLNDLALLKINSGSLPKNAKPLPLADSGALSIGQTVIAIGNPLGELENSVTKGIVSGINRNIIAGDPAQRGQTERLVKIIQTDASINPGNSGGPLIATNGEVVGINTAVNEAAQNIGFAIPAEDIQFIIKSYEKTGAISRAFVGVRYTMIRSEIKNKLKLEHSRGALIIAGPQGEAAVIAESPAARAGLREGDIILEAEGIKLDADRDLASVIRDLDIGRSIELKVWRAATKKEEVLRITLEELK